MGSIRVIRNQQREIYYSFFQIVNIIGFYYLAYVETIPSFELSKSFIEDSVYPTLLKGLTELARVKPASPTVILILVINRCG